MSKYVLCHHGVEGQRWGFRRWQNKDGSLTPAGRKRAHKLATQYHKLTGGNIREHQKTGPDLGHETKSDKIKTMSDEDLNIRQKRIDAELKYMRALEEYSELAIKLDPKVQPPLGKRIKDKAIKDVISPSAISIGKDMLTKYGGQAAAIPLDQIFGNTNNNNNNNNNNNKKK